MTTHLHTQYMLELAHERILYLQKYIKDEESHSFRLTQELDRVRQELAELRAEVQNAREHDMETQ